MNKEVSSSKILRDYLKELLHNWKFWLLVFLSILIIAWNTIINPMIKKREFYLNHEVTELYSHTTSQGYEIVISEKGHPNIWLSSHHVIVVEVNGEELVKCTVLTDYDHRNQKLYPKDKITCTKDTDKEYSIQFPINCCICFSADFEQVIYICAYEIDITGNLEVFECVELDWF